MLLQSSLQQRHEIVDLEITSLMFYLFMLYETAQSIARTTHSQSTASKTGEQRNKNDVSGSEREMLW